MRLANNKDGKFNILLKVVLLSLFLSLLYIIYWLKEEMIEIFIKGGILHVYSYYKYGFIIPVNEKQCESWSAGFIRGQLIWIYTVFNEGIEF